MSLRVSYFYSHFKLSVFVFFSTFMFIVHASTSIYSIRVTFQNFDFQLLCYLIRSKDPFLVLRMNLDHSVLLLISVSFFSKSAFMYITVFFCTTHLVILLCDLKRTLRFLLYNAGMVLSVKHFHNCV